MAEREGFEPSVPLLAIHAISSRAPSANSDISPLEFPRRLSLSVNGPLISFGGEGGIRTHVPRC